MGQTTETGMQTAGTMLNAYPDSMGGRLEDIVWFLQQPQVRGAFQSFYILPSLFNTDLDRGFSVIDYSLNPLLATTKDLEDIKKLGLDMKLDFILNHASVLSKQFQDILKNGEQSEYKDFFIEWNRFWQGCGEMTEEGYIQPDKKYIENMFFRKPGLPILMVRLPDRREVPYWNTFYQEVLYSHVDEQDLMKAMEIQYAPAKELANNINTALDRRIKPKDMALGKYQTYKNDVVELLESRRKYLGQMDLNIKSPLVWEFYADTLQTLASYGAKIVRLDAFAYAPKEPGAKNFLNEPGTWDVLRRVSGLANLHGLRLLPEIHTKYAEKTHEKLAQKGYMTYDFFLPGLILDALERKMAETLVGWAKEIQEKGLQTVNMLGCHDGIPLLDLGGLLPDEQIKKLIDTTVQRGGYVKNLHGQKDIYYQVNATYFSALGEQEDKLLLARAIQLFMPGKPQVWYLDLFAGKNDYSAVEKAGAGGHKEINRTNLTRADIIEGLGRDVVQKQLKLLRFRNTFPAFGFDAKMQAASVGSKLEICWQRDGNTAKLKADLKDWTFVVVGVDSAKQQCFYISEE